MNQSLAIATVFGSVVRLHWSWLLAPLGVAAYSSIISSGPEAACNVLLLLIVYFGVAIHEITKVLIARSNGIATCDLTLYPAWGVARLGRIGERPRQEIRVAMTGLLTLIALAAVVGGGLALTGRGIEFQERAGDVTVEAFLARTIWAVSLLAVLHAMPFLPVDGGQALRSVSCHACLAAPSHGDCGSGYNSWRVCDAHLCRLLAELAIAWRFGRAPIHRRAGRPRHRSDF